LGISWYLYGDLFKASSLYFVHWEEGWNGKGRQGLAWPGNTAFQEAGGQWGWVMIILQ